MGRTIAKLRGNERIQQLMDEFPEIPRTLVVKEDMLREGMRKTEAARRLGKWALPEAPWYFDYSKENAHSAEEIGNGYFLSPLVGHFFDGVAWQFVWDSGSPYEVRYEGAGRYQLYRDGDPIEEVFFPPRPEWMDRNTSSGKPMSAVVTQRGEDHATIAALQYCEYYKDGKGCRYCNIVEAESVRKAQGLARVTAKRDEDIYETVAAGAKEGAIKHLTLSGGVMLDVAKEAAMYTRITRVVKQVARDTGRELTVQVTMQAPEPEDSAMLKEAGVASVAYNLEVWDPRLFEIICPGKAKYVGQERWKERLIAAVPIFGRGRVSSTTVGGVELLHPDGFKSEDEAIESHLEHWRWAHKHEVRASAFPLRPGPGTMFEGMEAPRTEYFLRLELALYKLAVEHGVVTKPGGRPNKGPLPSISQDLRVLGLRQAPATSPPEESQ